MYNLKPNIIFTAHMHISRLIHHPGQAAENIADNRVTAIDIGRNNPPEIVEFMIPTSSYRMGVKNIGHGFAIIGEYGRRRNLRFIQTASN